MLGTDVVSELRRARTGRTDGRVVAWADGTAASALFLSVVTAPELERGVRLMERPDGTQGGRLRGWLETQVVPAFAGRVLPIDGGVARRCAGLHGPGPRGERDALTAATALVHGTVVVTRNVADFAPMVGVVDPWAG